MSGLISWRFAALARGHGGGAFASVLRREFSQEALTLQEPVELHPETHHNYLLRGKQKCLKLGNLVIGGHSIGGLSTCITLPQLDMCFDIGRCPQTSTSISNVFITHGHADHVGGIIFHSATRHLHELPPATYYVPTHLIDGLHTVFEGFRKLSYAKFHGNVVGIDPGDQVQIGNDQQHLKVHCFQSFHSIKTQGYMLQKRQPKLRKEFMGLPGKELRQLRLSGAKDVFDIKVENLFAFTGDTTPMVLNNPELMTCKVLVTEATFIDNRVTKSRARRKGHSHIDQVMEYVDKMRNDYLLLNHFSAKHRVADIQRIVGGIANGTRMEGRVVPFLLDWPAPTDDPVDDSDTGDVKAGDVKVDA